MVVRRACRRRRGRRGGGGAVREHLEGSRATAFGVGDARVQLGAWGLRLRFYARSCCNEWFVVMPLVVVVVVVVGKQLVLARISVWLQNSRSTRFREGLGSDDELYSMRMGCQVVASLAVKGVAWLGPGELVCVCRVRGSARSGEGATCHCHAPGKCG